jgi:hypothetical protein
MKTNWENSRAVCLMVRIKELLTHLYYHKMRMEMTVRVFVSGIKNCYNCEKIGHIKKSLPRSGTLPFIWRCQTHLGLLLECVSCKGKNTVFNQRCPLIIREKEIKSITANGSIDYIEARRIVEGWTQSWSLIGKGNSKTC